MKRLGWLVLLAALVCGGWFLYATGFFAATADVDSMRLYIARFAPYSQLVFFLIQAVTGLRAY